MRGKLYKNLWSGALLWCIILLLFSCEKVKKQEFKSGLFQIENFKEDFNSNLEGDSMVYIIKSDGLWKIEIVDGDDWVKVIPTEGSGDGTFKVIVDKNRTPDARTATLFFLSNYIRQSELLRVEQIANPDPPYFEIEDSPVNEEASWQGGDFVYHVMSNTNWSVVADAADWIHLNPSNGGGDGSFVMAVDENPEYTARTGVISFWADGVLLKYQIKVSQEGRVDETVLINEDFSWLGYGSPIFYNTTGQSRFDSWTQDQKDHGWTSTVNSVSGGGNTPMLYARPGFVVMGKTSYGGDLISPKLDGIVGVEDVIVSFKAIPYQTQAGTRDDNILNIEMIGPGTLSANSFTIDNWPDYSTDPDCTQIWTEPQTTRTFTVSGATSETQIRFIGQAFDLRAGEVPINKNRIFLDDIIVVLK